MLTLEQTLLQWAQPMMHALKQVRLAVNDPIFARAGLSTSKRFFYPDALASFNDAPPLETDLCSIESFSKHRRGQFQRTTITL